MKCPKCNTNNPDTQKYCGECATPLAVPEDHSSAFTKTLETPLEQLTRGMLFANRYEIIEMLGEGGMGRIYRVHDIKIQEEIALKLIKPEISSKKKTIERFRNELKIARKIRHKNVCGMYDMDEEKGLHFITMEYVRGEDLKSFMQRSGQIAISKVISITKQICEGLSEAHGHGIVHRDLKPGNIMIDKKGNAHIMDFGIARSYDAKGITDAGMMIGTPEYMSPEQSEAKEIDHRSDIYSLGVMLYEMVTGELPFIGETLISTVMKHKQEIPKDPRDINPQITDDLSNLILKCLEKERENRYQSVDQLISELENIEKGIPLSHKIIEKKPPLTSKEITLSFSVKKIVFPAVVILCIVLFGLIIWKPWIKSDLKIMPSKNPSIAVLYFENNSGNKELDHYRDGLSEWLITDLSQSKFLNVLSGDQIYSVLEKMDLTEAEKYTTEALKEMSKLSGAVYIIRGDYHTPGDQFVVNFFIHDMKTNKVMDSFTETCDGMEDILNLIDNASKKLKVKFNLSTEQINADIDENLSDITTQSHDALRFYIMGRKLHGLDNLESITYMERAVEKDPDFAMAFRSMAMTYRLLGNRALMQKYLLKAIELSDKVSLREKYNIQATYYFNSEKTYDRAIKTYKKLLELYPDDTIARQNLGNAYKYLEQWDRGIEQTNILIERYTIDRFVYTNISEMHNAKGNYIKSRKILEKYITDIQDIWPIHRELSNIYLCQGEYDQALNEIEEAIYLFPDLTQLFRQKAYIHLLKGDFDRCEAELHKILERKEIRDQLYGRYGLAILLLAQGKYREYENQLENCIELAKEIDNKGSQVNSFYDMAYRKIKAGDVNGILDKIDARRETAKETKWSITFRIKELILKGETYLYLKQIEEAEKTADALKQVIENWFNPKLMRNYYRLLGLIELERGNYQIAIEHFKKAISLLSYQKFWYARFALYDDHARFYEPLALTFFKSGKMETARDWYQKITLLTTGRLYYGDIYAKSFYMLGKVYKNLGDIDQAAKHYEKFLEIWKDADPGIPEVKDASERLKSLSY